MVPRSGSIVEHSAEETGETANGQTPVVQSEERRIRGSSGRSLITAEELVGSRSRDEEGSGNRRTAPNERASGDAATPPTSPRKPGQEPADSPSVPALRVARPTRALAAPAAMVGCLRAASSHRQAALRRPQRRRSHIRVLPRAAASTTGVAIEVPYSLPAVPRSPHIATKLRGNAIFRATPRRRQ